MIIVGATDIGELVLKLLGHLEDSAYRPIAFVDDDPGKRYRRIDGVPVLGTTDELPKLARKLGADLVVVALDRAAPALDRVRASCIELGLEYRELVVPASLVRGAPPAVEPAAATALSVAS